MLFHLKEPKYEGKNSNQIQVRIYGRTPEQIISLLGYYNQREKPDRNRSDLCWWLKKDFDLIDIEQVEKGEFTFFSGMISFAEEELHKPLFEELKINDEFTIYVPEENILPFVLYKTSIMERKRAELYKLQNPIEMFMNTSFVPRDIAIAIRDYNLDRYSKSVQQELAKREELSKHPNLQVNSLSKLVESAKKNIAETN